ncbi:WecB/TagA/CpsF family glycosyltransferase [Anaerovorax sp. IOR16]|uniref:WecB/TagA/CpsF family glycosyltransferase n=1 Tax=Anaerovorax sp. IOR16 TaxID=2773458 RepID=UPI0019D2290D|nr:WecB/TagA/CpsF family glycosyltransferase [Anaerovorax sp. IOR16]
MEEREILDILGISVDKVDMRKAISIFSNLMETEECSLIVTPNSEIIMNATKDESLRKIIASADLVIPDGIGLVYASKLLGQPLKERVTGIDFMEMILIWLQENEKSIYLFGSKPENEEREAVCDLAAKKKQIQYPNLKIAGTHHGYFKPEEENSIVEHINASGADFLCVALGSPKQEEFIARHRESLKVKAAIGVGGSFDVWAGTLKRAPEFYQNHGLEWLYRFIQEPTRYKRMAALPTFMIKVMAAKTKA